VTALPEPGEPRIVRIEKLAPTGEGIARGEGGVGFVDRALPGELVATIVYQVKKNFWRGSVAAVREPSPDRVDGPHAGCAGCDWAHFEPAAARRSKRELFLETMQRLARIGPELFGELPIEASAPGHRLRTRLHAARGTLGYFAPGTHRLMTAEGCEAIAAPTRELLPGIEAAIRESRAEVSEVALLEDIEGARRLFRATVSGAPRAAAELSATLSSAFAGVVLRGPDGSLLVRKGEGRLTLHVEGRAFHVSVDTFFQGNRHLVGRLYAAVRQAARLAQPGDALDAFGGAGLFAGALLDAGHRVTSVESEAGAAADAASTLEAWPDRERCETVASDLSAFLERDDRRFSCVVADPPRAGLGAGLSRELARRAEREFVYVSCDPATLGRDLAILLAEGFAIRHARLFDLFALTHRVEALVALERVA
jgi:tRNA/tmRNA/rRNA uracil-C5-methylase (TrmA/RlmC/RlmD family)